uniref:Uncharacterized protein n=1 Tax=Arundo donax TaxID=35708 RepID=A0A0A9DGQ4_ARUDO
MSVISFIWGEILTPCRLHFSVFYFFHSTIVNYYWLL